MGTEKLLAGASQIDITPDLGTIINGEFRCRYTNKIADNLFAKALVLENDKQILLIIMVDICAMRRDFVDPIKTEIFLATGIPPERQMIASTHAHSTGSVADLLMGHVDWAYRQWLPKKIIQVAVDASANKRSARIGWGSIEQPQHLLCRRYLMEDGYQAVNPVTGGLDKVKTNPFGDETKIVSSTTTPDSALRYLAIQDLEGQWISLLANYNLHYVGDCERGTISADYFGYFARSLASHLGTGQDFVGIMSNGTSGEINIWDFQDSERYPTGFHEKSKLIGEDLAAAVNNSLSTIVWEEEPILNSNYEELKLALRKPSVSELDKAKKIVTKTDYECINFGEPDFFTKIYAREQIFLDKFPNQIDFPIQSFRIGSGAIGALGGEFFSESGLKIKGKWANNHYFTICISNDYVGYVPPEHEIENGGYETWRCRTSCLEPTAESAILSKLMDQLDNYGNVV